MEPGFLLYHIHPSVRFGGINPLAVITGIQAFGQYYLIHNTRLSGTNVELIPLQ
jgi:hypothetical protein